MPPGTFCAGHQIIQTSMHDFFLKSFAKKYSFLQHYSLLPEYNGALSTRSIHFVSLRYIILVQSCKWGARWSSVQLTNHTVPSPLAVRFQVGEMNSYLPQVTVVSNGNADLSTTTTTVCHDITSLVDVESDIKLSSIHLFSYKCTLWNIKKLFLGEISKC